ncbi:MAG TPA: YaiO family outer membrane beta-barrel protein [Planctomycetota bacterium]|jgi:YaiO family outer membrane protein|nr:YaiO family outer membrane beta-barrel protein [Planctomycetota bacterium]
MIRSLGVVRFIVLLASAGMPLSAATMEEGLALKRAQDLKGAERVFSELVGKNPNDVDALEQLAMVTGWLDHQYDSLRLWERAILLAPEYHGLRVGRARVLYWMGRLGEAEEEIAGVLPKLPREAEAWELAGDIARARHHLLEARERYRQAAVIDPQSAAVRKDANLEFPKLWRLDVGGMFDDYQPANDQVVQRNHEQTAYVQLGYQVSDHLTLSTGGDYAHQFGIVDWRWNMEAYWSPLPDWSFHARGAVTPQADVLPEWEALVGGAWHIAEGVTPLLSIRTATYEAERIVTYMPGVRIGERVAAEARIYYTTSDVNNDTKAGVLRISTTIAERWQPYVLGSYGEENQPPVGVAKTASGAAGVVVGINRSVAVRVDGLYEWREDIHQRISLGGGFTLRF